MASKEILLTLIAALLLMIAATPTGVQPRGAESTLLPDYPVSGTGISCVPSHSFILKHPKDNIICSVPGYRDSGTDHLDSLIKHIKGLRGNAILGYQHGGRWCWRYSCQNNIGVYACNDDEFQDFLVPWSLLVDYIGHINRTCTIERQIDGKWTQRILGQAFHPDDWNVIVGISVGKGCEQSGSSWLLEIIANRYQIL